jgi:transposase InsO family protein
MDIIRTVFDRHKSRYGVRRIHHELLNMGHSVNHKKIQRLMKKMDLKGKRPKEKYHSYKGEVGKIAGNIINRDFRASKPDEKWTTDVSQFNLPFGKCYLSPILDMYTNEIISFDLSLHPNYEQIANMLNRAFEDHPDVKGLIFHSDQGWQYQMKEYRQELKDRDIIQSMSRKGNCIDNCIMETFFGRMKNEMFYGYESQYRTFEQFYKAVEEYIHYYNNERIQAKTKWMPPVKYREASILNRVTV